MADSEGKLDPIEVRTRLFAIVTAILESAHDGAAKGQSPMTTRSEAQDYIDGISEILGEVEIQLQAALLINSYDLRVGNISEADTRLHIASAAVVSMLWAFQMRQNQVRQSLLP